MLSERTRLSQGLTAVHEIGPWFGLWHTFESHARIPRDPPGGCIVFGDKVHDTPVERNPSLGCPQNRDSCRGVAELDPIHCYQSLVIKARAHSLVF